MTIKRMGVRMAMLSMVAVTMGSPALAQITTGFLADGNLNETINYNHDRIKFQTKGPTAVRVQELIFAPLARTGWHHHPGIVIVTVVDGSVTSTDHNCQTKSYNKGSVFVEGHETPTEVRAGADGAIVYATYVAPSATFRLNDAPITCSAALGFKEVPKK